MKLWKMGKVKKDYEVSPSTLGPCLPIVGYTYMDANEEPIIDNL